MEWSPMKGPMYTITLNYLTRLIVELEENKLSITRTARRKESIDRDMIESHGGGNPPSQFSTACFPIHPPDLESER